MSMSGYDGKWGREIREQLQRERAISLSQTRLRELRSIAAMAQKIIPGPWGIQKAGFITCDFIDGAPDTGRPVAEVDCYDEYAEQKRKYIATFDPVTVLKLIEMAAKNGKQSR